MDQPNEILTVATLFSALAYIAIMVIKQLAPSFIKRMQHRWDNDEKEEQAKAESSAAEDKLSIEAKSFLTEAAKEHLDTVRNMAQECQDEVKSLRKEVVEFKIQNAALQAKDEARVEEIQRIKKDYIQAETERNDTKKSLELAQTLVSQLQTEMSTLRQEMDRMHNQISVFESRLMSEQQNSKIIEKRLEMAEAELKVKDELLKESKLRNDKLSQDMRDLQRKLKEYATKLQTFDKSKDTNISDQLDTKELIARDYDDFSTTTQPSTPKKESDKAAEEIKPVEVIPVVEINPVAEVKLDTIKSDKTEEDKTKTDI